MTHRAGGPHPPNPAALPDNAGRCDGHDGLGPGRELHLRGSNPCIAFAIRGLVDAVLSIELVDVLRAHRLLSTPSLQARDAIHVAVMQRHDIGLVMSFDHAFDEVPGLTRVT